MWPVKVTTGYLCRSYGDKDSWWLFLGLKNERPACLVLCWRLILHVLSSARYIFVYRNGYIKMLYCIWGPLMVTVSQTAILRCRKLEGTENVLVLEAKRGKHQYQAGIHLQILQFIVLLSWNIDCRKIMMRERSNRLNQVGRFDVDLKAALMNSSVWAKAKMAACPFSFQLIGFQYSQLLMMFSKEAQRSSAFTTWPESSYQLKEWTQN